MTKIKIGKTKKELENLKTIRQFGVNDLVKYKEKIKKNILVFEEAIKKEETEMKRVDNMIKSLEQDIDDANKLLSKTNK